MNAGKNTIIWLVLFLLALSPVLAAEDAPTAGSAGLQLAEDFTATGTARILAFACSPAEGTITVTNTGDLPNGYDLVAEGTAKGWVMFAPESFTLLPGQSQTITEYFAIPCNAQNAYLDTAIQTEELELILSQDLIVQTPNNIVLQPIIYSQETMPCKTATFSFLLHNPAEFTETYKLKIKGAPEQTSLNDNSLILPPHENETITITTVPKDCSLAGDFTPVLAVMTEKTGLAAEIEMFLRINNSDIPEIAPGIKTISAGYAEQEAGISITNLGDRRTAYLARLDAPEWASIDSEQLAISPHETETIKLVLQPNEETPPGRYPATIKLLVESTGTEYTKELTIKLTRPTLATKLFAEYLPYTIGGLVLTAVLIILIVAGIKKYKSPEFQAKLAEKIALREQRKQEKLALKEEKRRQREEERQKREQEKQEEEERKAKEAEKLQKTLERERMKAQKALEKEIRRDNLVIAKDRIITGFIKKSAWHLKLAVIALVLLITGFVLSMRNAIAQNTNAILAGITVLAVLLALHRIRRKRVIRKRWKLALAGQEITIPTRWKKGLAEAGLTLSTVIEKFRLTIRRTRPSITAPQKTYSTFTISHNAETNVVSNARLTFSIPTKWFKNKNILPSTVRLAHLVSGKWQNITPEIISSDDKRITFSAETNAVGEFAITGKPSAERKAKKTKRNILPALGWTVFGIAALFAIISLIVLTPAPQNRFGIPPQVWKQDTEHTIQLDKYFKDPDNDPITFTATRTENIDITITGSKAILTPRYGWSGTERTVFIADDGKGGIVKSNTVDLVVEPKIIPNTWKPYAKTILPIALLIIVILGIILFRKQIKKIVGME
jgi:hypothetical protein